MAISHEIGNFSSGNDGIEMFLAFFTFKKKAVSLSNRDVCMMHEYVTSINSVIICVRRISETVYVVAGKQFFGV